MKENFEIFIKSNTLALCAGCMHDTSCFVNQNAIRAVRILAHYGTLLKEQNAMYPTMSQSKLVFKIGIIWCIIILTHYGVFYNYNLQCLAQHSVRNFCDEWPILIMTKLIIEWSITSRVFLQRPSMKKPQFHKCGNTTTYHSFFLRMVQFQPNMPCN